MNYSALNEFMFAFLSLAVQRLRKVSVAQDYIIVVFHIVSSHAAEESLEVFPVDFGFVHTQAWRCANRNFLFHKLLLEVFEFLQYFSLYFGPLFDVLIIAESVCRYEYSIFHLDPL